MEDQILATGEMEEGILITILVQLIQSYHEQLVDAGQSRLT